MFGIETIGGVLSGIGKYITVENVAKVGTLLTEADRVISSGYNLYKHAERVCDDITDTPTKIASVTRLYDDGSRAIATTYERAKGERVFEYTTNGF